MTPNLRTAVAQTPFLTYGDAGAVSLLLLLVVVVGAAAFGGLQKRLVEGWRGGMAEGGMW